MTIWILAFLLLASLAGLGYRQGAIRVAISLIGILFGVLLAAPIGGLILPLIRFFGGSNPLIAWAIAPIVGFMIVSIAFKIGAHFVHQKVEFYYKYEAGDLRLALWERINARLGLCLGLINGTAYFILICFVIFNLSYLTTQVAAAPGQPKLVSLANQVGRDLEGARMIRPAAAVASLPELYYKTADLCGLIIQNPQVVERLKDYPGLTSVWERDDIQPYLSDPVLTNALTAKSPLAEVLSAPSMQTFFQENKMSGFFLGFLRTNIDDLTVYLETGKSPKHDSERIIGQWKFNPNATAFAVMRQSPAKISSSQMRALRMQIAANYSKTHLLFTGDNQLFVRNYPHFTKPDAAPELNNLKGEWTKGSGRYDIQTPFNGADKFMTATIANDGERLIVKDKNSTLIFDKAD